MADIQTNDTGIESTNDAPSPQGAVTTEVPKTGRTGVGLVVVAAVVIAAGLVALGFYIYDAKDEPRPTPDTGQASFETLDRSSPLDEQVLSEEESQIDQTVQDLDNSSDFNEDELSDTSLGL